MQYANFAAEIFTPGSSVVEQPDNIPDAMNAANKMAGWFLLNSTSLLTFNYCRSIVEVSSDCPEPGALMSQMVFSVVIKVKYQVAGHTFLRIGHHLGRNLPCTLQSSCHHHLHHHWSLLRSWNRQADRYLPSCSRHLCLSSDERA